MYIKYLNGNKEIKIEKLDLTFLNTDCQGDDGKNIKVHEIRNNHQERLAGIIGNLISTIVYDLEKADFTCDCLNKYGDCLDNECNVVYVCGNCCLDLKQSEKFIKLIVLALENGSSLFDVTILNIDDIGGEMSE